MKEATRVLGTVGIESPILFCDVCFYSNEVKVNTLLDLGIRFMVSAELAYDYCFTTGDKPALAKLSLR